MSWSELSPYGWIWRGEWRVEGRLGLRHFFGHGQKRDYLSRASLQQRARGATKKSWIVTCVCVCVCVSMTVSDGVQQQSGVVVSFIVANESVCVIVEWSGSYEMPASCHAPASAAARDLVNRVSQPTKTGDHVHGCRRRRQVRLCTRHTGVTSYRQQVPAGSLAHRHFHQSYRFNLYVQVYI